MGYVNKTQPTTQSIKDFLAGIEDDKQRTDCQKLHEIHTNISGASAVMWGTAIVGYGEYTYQGKSRSGTWMRAAFSPRATNISVYIMQGFGEHEALLSKLGKYKNGKSCLYIKKLEDVDEAVLTELIQKSWDYMDRTYPE